jgi:Rsm1-like/C3HC zinc finger-like
VARLGTFRDILWSRLPDEVNEFGWARQGWVQRRDGVQGVRCDLCTSLVQVTCDMEELDMLDEEGDVEEETGTAKGVNGTGSRVREATTNGIHPKKESHPGNEPANKTTPVPDLSPDYAESRLISHFQPLISSAHKPTCPWKTRTEDASILRLPSTNLTLQALLTRLQSILSIQPSLPTNLTFPRPLASPLPPAISSFPDPVLIAGVTGWTASTLGTHAILVCETCHRRVALWRVPGEDEGWDLAKEHKRYCPWICARTQGGREPGWEILLSVLSTRKRHREEEGEGKLDEGGEMEDKGREVGGGFKRLREMLSRIKRK